MWWIRLLSLYVVCELEFESTNLKLKLIEFAQIDLKVVWNVAGHKTNKKEKSKFFDPILNVL